MKELQTGEKSNLLYPINDWIIFLAIFYMRSSIFAFLKRFPAYVTTISRGVMVEFNMGPQIGTTGKVKLGAHYALVNFSSFDF